MSLYQQTSKQRRISVKFLVHSFTNRMNNDSLLSGGYWRELQHMHSHRCLHTSLTLSDGKVLVTGGVNDGVLRSAELYDPSTGNWTIVRDMNIRRLKHTSSLLPNGKVLVTGGSLDLNSGLVYAELYDPLTNNWTMTDSMHYARFSHTASVLSNGKVLVVGGFINTTNDLPIEIGNCELYDPSTGK